MEEHLSGQWDADAAAAVACEGTSEGVQTVNFQPTAAEVPPVLHPFSQELEREQCGERSARFHVEPSLRGEGRGRPRNAVGTPENPPPPTPPCTRAGSLIFPTLELVLSGFSESCRVELFRRAAFHKAKASVASLMKELI